MKEEKIICAAIWYKEFKIKRDDLSNRLFLPVNCKTGIVFSGHRHTQCMYQQIVLSGLRQCHAGEEVQGFLTNKNRFVDRKEGAKIALTSGQIKKLKYGNILYSEDLY